MKQILVPIANGIEEIETTCITDILVRAGAKVIIASVHDHLEIIAARGLKIIADQLISQCIQTTFDLIVLPGGLPGAEHLRDSAILQNLLEKQERENRLFAAICASPAIVLNSFGLLKNRQATSYPTFLKELPHPVTDSIAIDQNCITSQGIGTALKFALKLVEVLYGENQANQIAKDILLVN